MPQLIPTSEELARMRPEQRARARRAIWAVVADTQKYIELEAQRHNQAAADGEAIRNHARLLERLYPRDPGYVTAERRRQLMEAVQ